MSRMRPECPKSDPSDRLLTTDAILRQEPDEEEEEDEGDGTEDDDEDEEENDEGYSVRACPLKRGHFVKVVEEAQDSLHKNFAAV